MDAPVLQRPDAHGQRHVGVLAGEAGGEGTALQLGLAAFQRLADARLEAVDGLPEGLALIARQGAQRRHQLGHAPLLAERGDAHALDARAGRRPPRSRRRARSRWRQGRWFGSSRCRSRSSSPAQRAMLISMPAAVHGYRDARDLSREAPTLRLGRRIFAARSSGMTGYAAFLTWAAAWSTSALKPAASLTARSASTLRSTAMPASARPLINRP